MDRKEYQRIYQQCWRAANPDYNKLYVVWWRAENKSRPKNYTRMHKLYEALTPEEKIRIPFNAWYAAHIEEMSPTKINRQFVAKDKKHNAEPKPPKPPKPPRHKMTDIEKKRRKIELELERIDARRKAWRDANDLAKSE